MKTRREFIGGAAATAAAGVAWFPSRALAATAPLSGTVTIAVAAPFSGDQIRAGEQMANGVRAATDDANRFRGPLDRAYAMRTFDDQDLLAEAIQNAGFACDDDSVVAVIGHLTGKITEIAEETYAKNQMPVIVPASSYDRLTAHGYGNLLRLPTKDSIEGQLAAKHVLATMTVKPKSICALVQDGDYGADVAIGFTDELSGSKVPVNAVVFSYEKPDFPAVVKATIARTPDAVFFAGTAKDMGPAAPALRAAGYTGPFYGSQGFFDPITLTKYAKDVEGLICSSSMPPLQLAPGAFRIRNDFEAKYGAMTPLSAFSYAAAQIVIAAVRRTGAQDRVAVLRAINTGASFDTVVGSFNFANTGDSQSPQIYFYTVTNGAWRYGGSALPTSFVVK